ncbi:hypothetical protein DGWBC_1768 [Dehalogenimonas sp. WBC-2]|nr:hypothetical protein DGWBC_1768 [Dehalogenimonas sp. WBC-2]
MELLRVHFSCWRVKDVSKLFQTTTIHHSSSMTQETVASK